MNADAKSLSFTNVRNLSFLFCLIALLIPHSASAQSPTGFPPFNSYAGAPDILNLGDLNAHYTIPIFRKAGRGMNFAYDATYDSVVWTPVQCGSAGNQRRIRIGVGALSTGQALWAISPTTPAQTTAISSASVQSITTYLLILFFTTVPALSIHSPDRSSPQLKM